MKNNQTKCGIIYEKIAMRAGDDERVINYEWSNSQRINGFQNNLPVKVNNYT